jgi:hypothetical protein
MCPEAARSVKVLVRNESQPISKEDRAIRAPDGVPLLELRLDFL